MVEPEYKRILRERQERQEADEELMNDESEIREALDSSRLSNYEQQKLRDTLAKIEVRKGGTSGEIAQVWRDYTEYNSIVNHLKKQPGLVGRMLGKGSWKDNEGSRMFETRKNIQSLQQRKEAFEARYGNALRSVDSVHHYLHSKYGRSEIIEE